MFQILTRITEPEFTEFYQHMISLLRFVYLRTQPSLKKVIGRQRIRNNLTTLLFINRECCLSKTKPNGSNSCHKVMLEFKHVNFLFEFTAYGPADSCKIMGMSRKQIEERRGTQ